MMFRSFLLTLLAGLACLLLMGTAVADDMDTTETYVLSANGSFESDALEDRATRVFREIKCPICTTQSVAESDAEISKSLRDHIRREIADGKTDAEIFDGMAASYGSSILLRPRVSASTLPLWIAPWLFALIGFGVWRTVHLRQAKKRAE